MLGDTNTLWIIVVIGSVVHTAAVAANWQGRTVTHGVWLLLLCVCARPVAEAVVQEAVEAAKALGPMGSSSGRGLPQIERIRLNVHANQVRRVCQQGNCNMLQAMCVRGVGASHLPPLAWAATQYRT